MTQPAPRVCHVITGLGTGGAETMLWKLLAGSRELREGASVVSLRDAGTIGPRIEALGVPVTAIGIGRVPTPGAIHRLRTRLREARADVVQGWMYHGNLAALLRPDLGGRRPPVLWNIRQSLGTLGREKRATAAVIVAGTRLSRLAWRIVYNSSVSAREHERLGYAPERTVIIPNGFDLETFRPEPAARGRLRTELGVGRDAVLVGLVASFHPMKDHANFFAATAPLLELLPRLHLVLAGKGVEPGNPVLAALLPRGPVRDRVHLLGEVPSERLMPGLDVFVLSSGDGEGFPNVVGEAMACEIPCVVTDSGDAPAVVGDAGVVVPRRTPLALESAIRDLLLAPPDARLEVGRRARRRVAEHFALDAIAGRYADLYREAASSC